MILDLENSAEFNDFVYGSVLGLGTPEIPFKLWAPWNFGMSSIGLYRNQRSATKYVT